MGVKTADTQCIGKKSGGVVKMCTNRVEDDGRMTLSNAWR